MNLFDLIRRPDRATAVTGKVETRVVRLGRESHRAVVMTPGASIRVRNAQELTVCRMPSADWNWAAASENGKGGTVSVIVENNGRRHLLATCPDLTAAAAQLQLSWPADFASWPQFDLVVETTGQSNVVISMGRLVDMREFLRPYAKGVGIEVGPGMTPAIPPTAETDVKYIEKFAPADWARQYNLKEVVLPPDHLLERYTVASATELEAIEHGSLDFIFSSHVFEHLPNPLQVLTNWLSRLKPGGAVIGVVPDPRYSFDCRQTPTTIGEVLAEHAHGGHAIPRAKYERWVRHTEPNNSVDDLIRRDYSIHVNWFTPEGMLALCDLLNARGLIDRRYVWTAPNNKDFAFGLWKRSSQANEMATASE